MELIALLLCLFFASQNGPKDAFSGPWSYLCYKISFFFLKYMPWRHFFYNFFFQKIALIYLLASQKFFLSYCNLKIVIFANSGKFLDFLAILTTPNSPVNLQNISIISISVISMSYNHSRSLKGFKIFDWTPIGWSAMEWAISNIFFICIFYWSSINSNNNSNDKCNDFMSSITECL